MEKIPSLHQRANGTLHMILLISALISLIIFYVNDKGYTITILKTLRTNSFEEIAESQDPSDEIYQLSKNFDPTRQSVILAATNYDTSEFSWLKVQVDYHFYPIIPKTFHFQQGDNIPQYLHDQTKPGDIVFTVEQLNLDNQLFILTQTPNFLIYRRI